MGENDRRAHRALLERLFETMAEGVLLTDPNGRVMQANPAVARILGRDPSELEGREYGELRWECLDSQGEELPPERLPTSLALHEKRAVRDVALGVRRPDGSVAWIRASADPLYGATGEIEAVICTITDITVQTHAEEALRESEARLRAQFKRTPIPIFTWRTDGDDLVLVEYNDAALKFTSGAVADFLGTTASQMYAETPQIVEELRRCLKEQTQITRTMPYRMRTTGEHKTLVANYICVPPDTVMVHTEDITERRRTEDALRESEEELRSIVSSMDDLVFVLDRNHTFVSFHQPTKTHDLYVPPEQFLGRPFQEIMPPDVVRLGTQAIAQALATGEVQQFDYPLETDGEERWYSAKVSVRLGGDGKPDGVTVVSREITERRRLQQELESARADLERRVADRTRELLGLRRHAEQLAALRERERLARELHDAVTQTLFSASLISDALPAVWERDPQEGRQRLGDLRSLTRGALAEMRRLLLDLRPPTVADADMCELLRQVAESVGERTGLRIRVETGEPCHLPPAVKVALYRIAQEALNNCAKHASASQATVTLARNEERLELSVVDDGRGFDPDPLAPDALGLSIMRERAESVGARLEVDSRLGRGTRVAVCWEPNGEAES